MRPLVLLAFLILAACSSESGRAAEEKRALNKEVAAAQDRAHKLKMKELEGGELGEEERGELERLKAQAEEDQNAGTTPEASRPQPEAPAEPPPAGG